MAKSWRILASNFLHKKKTTEIFQIYWDVRITRVDKKCNLSRKATFSQFYVTNRWKLFINLFLAGTLASCFGKVLPSGEFLPIVNLQKWHLALLLSCQTRNIRVRCVGSNSFESEVSRINIWLWSCCSNHKTCRNLLRCQNNAGNWFKDNNRDTGTLNRFDIVLLFPVLTFNE